MARRDYRDLVIESLVDSESQAEVVGALLDVILRLAEENLHYHRLWREQLFVRLRTDVALERAQAQYRALKFGPMEDDPDGTDRPEGRPDVAPSGPRAGPGA